MIENVIHGLGLFPLNPINIDESILNPPKAIIRITESTDTTCFDQVDVSIPATGTSAVDQVKVCIGEPIANTSILINTVADITISQIGTVADITMSSTDRGHREAAETSSKFPTDTVGQESVCHLQPVRETYPNNVLSLCAHAKSTYAIRNKFPKALSGKEALMMLKEKEEEKRAEEEAKQKRKEERPAKRKQKAEEKEGKLLQREEIKRKRTAAKTTKLTMQAKKRKATQSSSSESDANDDVPNIMDSDDDFDEKFTCMSRLWV